MGKKFNIKEKLLKIEGQKPGPLDYSIPTTLTDSFGKSMGKKLKDTHSTTIIHNPGPGKY